MIGVDPRLQRYIGERPRIFFGVYGARPSYRRLLVSRDTRLVIEGFPRSGNTFAVYAFERAQESAGQPPRLAHHLHAPAQVIRAVRWKLPCLVLIRQPVDAALSLVIRDPRISLRQALLHYISFYETSAKYSDGFVLASFEQVTVDYGTVIERVNERFGTGFLTFRHEEENVAGVFATIEEAHRGRRDGVSEERIARPSAAKASAKAERKAELEKHLASPELRALVERAGKVYERLTSS